MSYKILIVDDSAITRAVLKRTIQMIDLPVEGIYEACNGKEGLAQLKKQPVDVVFTDLNMPEMNGMEMASAIQQDPQLQQIPVVVVTTESSEVRLEELIAKGARKYVHKPFTPEMIRDVLTTILMPCSA
ncbi:MAG: response regulator [Sedimentisphaerales bacterium]|nr:response regulator [Sedimentisphaerales bacterium]